MNLNRLDLISLRLFVSVVDLGSLTHGAKEFGISLAAASKRISELETHMGQTLLIRGKKGVTPSPAGEAMYRHSVELVGRLAQLSHAMSDFHLGTHGHLRIWANPSAFAHFLPHMMSLMSQHHPQIRMELEDVLSHEVVRTVVSGGAELGVIAENTPAEGLETVLCEEDELVLIAPAQHPLCSDRPVRLQEILSYDLVGMNMSTSLMRQINGQASLSGQTARLRVQVRGFDNMCKMVAAGVGVAILPHLSALPLASALGLSIQRIEGEWIRRRLYLAMRNRTQLSMAARAFVALIPELTPPDSMMQLAGQKL
jgi:DNA-binding transcriptional LysR family regulator